MASSSLILNLFVRSNGTRDVDNVTRSLTGLKVAAGALALGLGVSIKAAANFDKTIRQIGAATGESGAHLKELSELALKMGKDTSFSAGEAGAAMLELAKGGLSAAEIKAGSLKATLTLAAAGGLELATAAGFMVQGLSTFGLTAGEANKVAAALAGGAQASTASVESLGQALSQVGPGAKLAGLSIEETTGILAAFDKAGLKGSDAGTSLKTMLLALVPATSQAREAMEKYGLKFTDANGQFLKLRDIAGQLKDKLGGLSAEQQQVALKTIFGTDAFRAAAIAMNLGAEGIDEYTDKTSDLLTVMEMAEVNTSGATGALEQLQGTVETLSIKLGDAFLPALAGGAKGLSDLLGAADSLPGPVEEIGGTFLRSTVAAGALTAAFTVMIPRIAATRAAMASLGLTSGVLVRRFALLAAAIAAVDLVGKFGDWGRAANGFEVNVTEMARSLLEFNKTGQASGELARVFGEDLGGLREAMDGVAHASTNDKVNKWIYDNIPLADDLTDGFNRLARSMGFGGVDPSEKFRNLTDKLHGADEALAKIVDAGGIEKALAAVEKISQETGLSVDALAQHLPRLTEALRNQDFAAQLAADSTKMVGEAAAAAGDQAAAATMDWDAYRATLEKLIPGIAGVDEANLKSAQRWDEIGDAADDAARKAEDYADRVAQFQSDSRDAMNDLADSERDLSDAREDGVKKAMDLEKDLARTREDAVDRIVDAERDLRDAREEGPRRTHDLERDLGRAKEDFPDEIKDLEKALAEAKEGGDADKISDAEKDLRRAREDGAQKIIDLEHDLNESRQDGPRKAMEAERELARAHQEGPQQVMAAERALQEYRQRGFFEEMQRAEQAHQRAIARVYELRRTEQDLQATAPGSPGEQRNETVADLQQRVTYTQMLKEKFDAITAAGQAAQAAGLTQQQQYEVMQQTANQAATDLAAKMTAMGASAQEIEEFTSRLRNIAPPVITPQVDAAPAEGKMDELSQHGEALRQKLMEPVATNLDTTDSKNKLEELWEGLKKYTSAGIAAGAIKDQGNNAIMGLGSLFAKPGDWIRGGVSGLFNADGGMITGPGGPRSDRIPAWLSNGEYVVNARSTAANRGLLEAINAGRYAGGGMVGFPSYGMDPRQAEQVKFMQMQLAAYARNGAPDQFLAAFNQKINQLRGGFNPQMMPPQFGMQGPGGGPGKGRPLTADDIGLAVARAMQGARMTIDADGFVRFIDRAQGRRAGALQQGG